LPTISAENPYMDILKRRGLTRDEFRMVFIEGTIRDWADLLGTSERKELIVYTRSDACGAAGTWADFLGGKQENLKGVGIYGDPGLAEAVSKDPAGLGFNNTIFIYDVPTGLKRNGIEVIPLDINGNGHIDPEEDFYDTFDAILGAIAEGAYPSPPARELYFVSNGKPAKAIALEFIRWTLTEGQRFVREAGYVPIDQGKLDSYLNKLKQ
jgi:phosphate transport system substrate-binding protein